MTKTFVLAFILLISAISIKSYEKSIENSKKILPIEDNPRKLDGSTSYNSYIEVIFRESITYK